MRPPPPHICNMKHILAPLALTILLATPAMPQDTSPTLPPGPNDGLGLIDRGMRLLFEGLMQDVEPALEDMAEAMKSLQPMARQLADLIGDVQYYDAPQRLENGDIIIRRKADAPPPPALLPALPKPDANPAIDQSPDGQIEL